MNSEPTTHRRAFLGHMFGAVAAASLAMSGTLAAGVQESGPDEWIGEVKGTHRCLFDFPQHKNGYPLLHILNYLNTYATAYKTGAGQVGAVGTFYSVGSQASIALAFNDSVWATYELGAYTGLKDSAGRVYTRNVFNRPTANDLHLLMELEARGKGKAQDIEKDLRANVLPGVTIVPAMVIAIEKAQEAGIRYNRQ
jgi:hypothetical protein